MGNLRCFPWGKRATIVLPSFLFLLCAVFSYHQLWGLLLYDRWICNVHTKLYARYRSHIFPVLFHLCVRLFQCVPFVERFVREWLAVGSFIFPATELHRLSCIPHPKGSDQLFLQVSHNPKSQFAMFVWGEGRGGHHDESSGRGGGGGGEVEGHMIDRLHCSHVPDVLIA